MYLNEDNMAYNASPMRYSDSEQMLQLINGWFAFYSRFHHVVWREKKNDQGLVK